MAAPRFSFAELIAKSAGMMLTYVLALFLPAGTLAWVSGWIYVAVTFAFSIALTVWLARQDPELLAERLGGFRQPGRKRWDKIFIPILFVAFFAWLALMGLDAVRFCWSNMSILLQIAGCVLLPISFYVFYLTFRENPYLSPAVRIQKERRQKVISTGPYGHVRHPMYAGFILYVIGTALMLGSWLGVAFGMLLIGAVARRAIFEEQTLQQDLPGYDAYMKRVQYRLIPGIW
jgi:protein-S-isoprenylcysteine O-methyltransferase Ste14